MSLKENSCRRVTTVVGALAMLSLFACSDSDQQGNGAQGGGKVVRHPVDAYSPYREIAAQGLILNELSSGGDSWKGFLGVRSEPSATIGGDQNTPFGEVSHLVQFLAGFAVGDNEDARVRVFSSNGKSLGSIGRSGEGPGEFRRITAMTQMGENEIAVADVMHKVEIFEITDSLEYRRTVPLDFSATSICTIEDRIFAYASPGPDTLPPIRVLDTSWTELARIGRSYRSPNPMINTAMGEVTVLCAPRLKRLVVVPRAGLGDVYILATDGSPITRFEWTDYHSLAILEDSSGYSATIEPGGLNRFRSGTIIMDSLVLLQYEFISEVDFQAREGATKLHSALVNIANGEVVARSSEWPALLVLRDGNVVARMPSDWPGLRVYYGLGR